MLKLFALLLLSAVIGAAAWPDVGGNEVLAMFQARQLTKVTAAQKPISPAQSALCASVPGPPDGPHEGNFIDVFVSVRQAAAFTAGSNDFPEGTVVVKEKRDGPDGAATLCTVMLKRAPGYDPADGDWEYLVVDGRRSRVIARGQIASCMQCHAKHAGTGFLVRDYLAAAAPGR